MIYYSIPYSVEKNLGKAYNDFMEILPNENDYACFVDSDTIFTTPNYGHIIDKVINENLEIGCFIAKTNRINCSFQLFNGVDVDTNDISYHREFGKNVQSIYGTYCVDVTHISKHELMSGFLMVVKKELWNRIGRFDETMGMLGIDNDFHKKIKNNNEKVYQMKGIYLYHWYRWPDPTNKEHLL